MTNAEERQIAERVEDVMSQWPTLDEAYGCVDCRHLFRRLVGEQACPSCASKSVFNAARIFHKEAELIDSDATPTSSLTASEAAGKTGDPAGARAKAAREKEGDSRE